VVRVKEHREGIVEARKGEFRERQVNCFKSISISIDMIVSFSFSLSCVYIGITIHKWAKENREGIVAARKGEFRERQV